MQDFTSGGKTIHFRLWRGQVTGYSQRSDRYVSQSFFVRPAAGGPEQAVQLSFLDVPLANGQDVTVIAGIPGGGQDALWVRLVNHSADHVWRLEDSRWLVKKWKLVKKWWLLGVAIWIGIGIWLILGRHEWSNIGFWAVIGFGVYNHFARKSTTKALEEHLSKECAQLLAHH